MSNSNYVFACGAVVAEVVFVQMYVVSLWGHFQQGSGWRDFLGDQSGYASENTERFVHGFQPQIAIENMDANDQFANDQSKLMINNHFNRSLLCHLKNEDCGRKSACWMAQAATKSG